MLCAKTSVRQHAIFFRFRFALFQVVTFVSNDAYHLAHLLAFRPRVDYKALSNRADEMRKNLQHRNVQGDVDAIIALYKESVELSAEMVQLRQQRNVNAEEMRANGPKMTPEQKKALVSAGKQIKDRLTAIEGRLETLEEQLLPTAASLPNFTHPGSPFAEEGPRIVKWVGSKPTCVGF